MHPIFLMLVLTGPPATPVMSGPVEVERNVYARLAISDLPVSSLEHANITVWPEVGTELLPLRTWGGEPLMLFRASEPGRYLVKVVVPVLEGKEARLLSVEHIIEVRGPPTPPVPPTPPEPPTPPPGPDPPQPPETTGVAYVIVIRRNQDITADQAETLIRLRTWSDARQQQVSQLEFDPDTAGDNGQLWAARVPAGERLPYWFLARQRAAGGSGVAILRQGPLPENWQVIVGEVEGLLQ